MPNIELTTATDQQKEDIRNAIDALGVAKDANGNMVGTIGPNDRAIPSINIEAFFDGVRSVGAAINAAYLYAESIGGATVVWPAKQYTTSQTITCGPLSATSAAPGSSLLYTGTGDAFVVQGVSTSETVGPAHTFPYINRQSIDWNSGADTTSVGLRIQDRKYNIFFVPGIKRFNRGLLLQAVAANCVCNTINLGVLQNNRIGIDFSEVGGAWGVNQNSVIGGSIVIDGAWTTAANRIYINMPNAAENNGNTFVGVNLEKGGNEKAIVCASSNNVWLNCRFEGAATTAGYITISGNNNTIFGGAPASSATVPFVTWLTDTGVGNLYRMGNVMANKFLVWDLHSAPRALRFGNGAVYPAVPIGGYGTDRLALGDSTTAGVRYYGVMVQEEAVVTSGTTLTVAANHYQMNYSGPATVDRITAGSLDQTTSSIVSVTDIVGNITLAHTAGPAPGAGRFVMKAAANKTMVVNQPVLFVAVNGNLYEV